MRLSSLSRKLKLKPSELELFYENKGIELLASSNSKLSDEQIKIALEYYDFQEEEEVVVDNSDHLAQSSDHEPIISPRSGNKIECRGYRGPRYRRGQTRRCRNN